MPTLGRFRPVCPCCVGESISHQQSLTLFLGLAMQPRQCLHHRYRAEARCCGFVELHLLPVEMGLT